MATQSTKPRYPHPRVSKPPRSLPHEIPHLVTGSARRSGVAGACTARGTCPWPGAASGLTLLNCDRSGDPAPWAAGISSVRAVDFHHLAGRDRPVARPRASTPSSRHGAAHRARRLLWPGAGTDERPLLGNPASMERSAHGQQQWRKGRPVSATRAASSCTRWRCPSLSPCRGARVTATTSAPYGQEGRCDGIPTTGIGFRHCWQSRRRCLHRSFCRQSQGLGLPPSAPSAPNTTPRRPDLLGRGPTARRRSRLAAPASGSRCSPRRLRRRTWGGGKASVARRSASAAAGRGSR